MSPAGAASAKRHPQAGPTTTDSKKPAVPNAEKCKTQGAFGPSAGPPADAARGPVRPVPKGGPSTRPDAAAARPKTDAEIKAMGFNTAVPAFTKRIVVDSKNPNEAKKAAREEAMGKMPAHASPAQKKAYTQGVDQGLKIAHEYYTKYHTRT